MHGLSQRLKSIFFEIFSSGGSPKSNGGGYPKGSRSEEFFSKKPLILAFEEDNQATTVETHI